MHKLIYTLTKYIIFTYQYIKNYKSTNFGTIINSNAILMTEISAISFIMNTGCPVLYIFHTLYVIIIIMYNMFKFNI